MISLRHLSKLTYEKINFSIFGTLYTAYRSKSTSIPSFLKSASVNFGIFAISFLIIIYYFYFISLLWGFGVLGMCPVFAGTLAAVMCGAKGPLFTGSEL